MMADFDKTTLDADPVSAREGNTKTLGIVWAAPRPIFTPLDKDQIELGRASSNDVQLPSDLVSRCHARIHRAGPAWLLRDNDSRNGSFHNGRRVTEAPLAEHDVLRLGDWLGVVRAVADPESPLAGPSPIPVAGDSMRATLASAKAAAPRATPVLLIGATGTGKEVVSRAIHEWSGREGAFVAVNCAALPETLAEAALFGHKKGAYTGADRDGAGFFREAHGGTLLLDEIGDLPLPVQAKLLRVLEDGAVTPVGTSRAQQVDVRIIAAAQPNLPARISAGTFRSDLYARLQGVELALPLLRDRVEEVPPLLRHHLERETGGAAPSVHPELVEHLLLHDWPLNVREVVQLARHFAALHAKERVLTQRHLPQRFHAATQAPASDGEGPRATAPVAGSRREQANAHRNEALQSLLDCLRTHGGNVSKAATAAGMTRRQAYRLLELVPELDLASFRAAKG